ncbi:MAG: hypothetical protein K0B11_22555 [Mariniphaga sp.]|nr:hypothetical protein [Mariniphaga sp.]
MDTLELKRSFHHLIDSIENDDLLFDFYELLKNRTSAREGQLWGNLSKTEKDELLTSLEESKSSYNLISHSEMKKKHKKRL